MGIEPEISAEATEATSTSDPGGDTGPDVQQEGDYQGDF